MCVKKDIGENVRNMRIERGWSQYALAVASGMKTGSYIGSVERAACSIGITNLARIAKGLQVNLAMLLETDPAPLEKLDAPVEPPFIHAATFLTMVQQCRNSPEAILSYLERAGIKVIR
jgi:transcriptional regulator with XRE-family HTH domain